MERNVQRKLVLACLLLVLLFWCAAPMLHATEQASRAWCEYQHAQLSLQAQGRFAWFSC